MNYGYAALAVLVLCTFPRLAGAEPAASPQGALAPALSGHPPLPTRSEQPAVTGKVLETMNAGGYTYVRVSGGDGDIWAAGPQTSVAVGDTVSFERGMEMKDFRSDKLDRTFETISFVNSITVSGAPGTPARPAAQKVDPHGAIPAVEGAGVDLSEIARVEGGKTVAEIFEQKDALAGKEVALRAKVVKVNLGIMGRNWLHLRDGTTGPNGANDLTITSSGAAEVGTTVVVRGKVVLNKDLGFGYRYDVIVEDAAITAE